MELRELQTSCRHESDTAGSDNQCIDCGAKIITSPKGITRVGVMTWGWVGMSEEMRKKLKIPAKLVEGL